MQIRWWRVCMDEAQMIESGVSKSATLARLLPRVNAWGVTGTPVKDSVEGCYMTNYNHQLIVSIANGL